MGEEIPPFLLRNVMGIASQIMSGFSPRQSNASLAAQAKEAHDAMNRREIENLEKARDAQTAGLAHMPVLGTRADIHFARRGAEILPADIPREFEPGNQWFDWAQDWYHNGAKTWPSEAVEGVDYTLALYNLTVLIRDVEVPRDLAIRGVAYLGSLWFVSPHGKPTR